MTRHSIRNTSTRGDALRQMLAQHAARIMIDQGVDDFLLAKRKAAERLRVRDQSVLPSNAEIEAAVAEHHRLFHADTHETALQQRRDTAWRLMQWLDAFSPRLVGSVLSGTATTNSEISLHVFTDQPELVALRLHDRNIDAKHAEKKLRYEAARQITYPSFKFFAGDFAVEVVVLADNDIRQAPLSPVDGKPMRRADLGEVARLRLG